MIEWIISSSLLILAVIALRAVFKGKIRPLFQYALWGIVLLRLLIPFSFFESSFSIMNVLSSLRSVEIAQAAEELSGYEDFVLDVNPPLSLETEEEFVSYPGEVHAYHYSDSDYNFPTTVLEGVSQTEFQQLENAVRARNILIPLWLSGVAVVLCVFLYSNLRFVARLRRCRKHKLESAHSVIPVFVSDAVETPCLFGLIRPKIYVTPNCDNDERMLRHVLVHENTHYRHGDNVWGVLRCLALALHWYNPLVWWAALISKRDAELACDDGALRRLGNAERADYGRTLIGLTCTRGDFTALALTATTMTGSKKSLRERIIFIAKQPKTAVYALLAVIVIAAAAITCTFSGVDSGFSDREARREAISLANSVAMANSCRIEGRGEILRYEGARVEANPETNVQYVRVSYPTRNGLQKINVEFCMTDGKGQHYDEPFSVTSWLSRSYTQIVPVPADYIESVHIWRDGYAPPVIPEAYREEIKEYVTQFFYADEYPPGALMSDSLNDAGFTVFMKDGSSVSFGVDYAKLDGRCYKIAKPEEMPDWLTELLVLPVRTKPAYGDLIKIDDTIKAEVDPYIISYAVDIMISQIDHYVFMRGIEIIDAKLTALECINTGAADQYGNAVEMYRVEYRLLPKNADGILLTDDMKMEDGWLTEWSSEGQPYMLFYLGDGNYREILRFINTEELDATYSTDTMLERYGNKYTAAAMEIYHTFVGQYGYQFYVMLGTGGAPISPYYHEKHRVTYHPDIPGWLSASGMPLDPNASFPTVTISDDPDDVNSDFLAFNRFIKHGELEIRDENFNILDLSPQVFYDGSDLYALPPGNYHVSFDITVPGKYIPELGEHEWTIYMCIFRLEVVDWENYSDQPQNIRIDVPQSDETAMCLYAWPVVLENIMEWLPLEDISSVIDVISTSSFTELDENNDSFNPKLAELNITGDISGGDVLDRYIFIHTHDYREELVKMLNYASDEELNALTKPLCILIYDYNIEKQEEFVYAIFNGRYYLADNESKIRIMDMFETLVDKHDTISN